MKIVFMGTPDFAVPCLEALVQAGHEVVAAVCQPDRPKGRGGKLDTPPVKDKAVSLGIPVYQPQKVREGGFPEVLGELAPDVIVVVAFGQILPPGILTLPRYGCVNVHASLLPAWRGAAPIQWAVINGDRESGVTTMQMDAGLDTGDILLAKKLALSPKETGGSLFDKLSALGAEALVETLAGMEGGTIRPAKQGDPTTPYAKMLKKEMGRIDFSRPAEEIERLIRGLNPWPSAYATVGGKTLKIWEADVAEELNVQPGSGGRPAPGTVAQVGRDGFAVACGSGFLLIREVQIEGKKRMMAGDFLRGFQLPEGSSLM